MKVSDLVWKFVSITSYNYHLALQIAVQLTMVQISTESSQKYTNFGMWKTGSAKCFSQTMEKVPFRFRIRKTENGKRKREKNGFANSQIWGVWRFFNQPFYDF